MSRPPGGDGGQGVSSSPPSAHPPSPPSRRASPCPAASFARPRTARGQRTKGAAPSNAAPGNAPGPWRTVECATQVDCRLGGAPCPVFRPLAWASDRGCGGIGLPGCRILCVEGRGLHVPALHGAACVSQRRGLAPQGRYPQDDGADVLCSARYRRGANAGAGAGVVEPPMVFAIRAACQSPGIGPPRKARAGGLAEPGAAREHGPLPHRVSNAMGRPPRLRNDRPGPPPPRESSCSTTGGASVAPAVRPAGDAAPAGGLRRWCGRCTRAGRPSHHA